MNSNFDDIFSFEDASKTYKKYKGKCKTDADCPDDLTCLYDNFCQLSFQCSEHDLTRCYNYNKDREDYMKYRGSCVSNKDCLTNSCIDGNCSGRLVYCSVGSGEAECGLDTGETCTKDSECLEHNCKDGICEKYDASKDFNRLALIVVIGILIFLLICYYLWPKLFVRRCRSWSFEECEFVLFK
ncbi:hypothetical protein BCR32DRAFT_290942 [Anaeromyces robustus]|uniref:Uncharacterized protein n=1 Tax=Anaeromyces robustus TaxID=1754192 RepID=A0A1Y1XH52_9FUNG|nr:hypothetical protein BCR32DRAFT_290942 [Anaeromyces robustus]|eukprot:ORX85089.1 hypothetical protein BCR32DRAFT_290942 [Anaeromyces robustus]